MKKFLAILLSVLLLCACLPLGAMSVAAAKSGTTGDCTWTLDDDGHLTISGNGEMGDYDYDRGPWGDSITSVTIENGVTTIGEQAFDSCDSLTLVTIGDSITTIGQLAFAYCTSLTSVTIPDSVTTIGVNAFACCESLKSVTIPDSVTTIGYGAFDDTAYYNTSSNWENDLLYIGNHLVKAKKSLSSSCNIKKGTLTIASYAFFYCTSLTSVTIPDSVTTIGDYAFSDCTSLTDVYYGGDESDHAAMEIGDENDSLQNATWHYNHNVEQPLDEPETNEEKNEDNQDQNIDEEKNEDNKEQNSDEDTNLVVIIVIVIAILLAVIAVLLFLLLKKKKSAK